MAILKKFIGADTVGTTKIQLENNQAIRARNQAGTADVDLMKLDGSDILQFLTLPRVSSDPTHPNDLARKSYVENLSQGVAWKQVARAAIHTTGLPAYTYSNGSSGLGATITANANGAWDSADSDDVVLQVGDRVVIYNDGVAAIEFGIYTVTSLGDGSSAWSFTRAVDADGSPNSGELLGATVTITEGTTHAGYTLRQNTPAPITVGTTALLWDHISSGLSYDFIDGLQLVGSDVSVKADTTGGANLAKVVNVSTNGVAVKVDDSSIEENASGQLGIKANGVTSAMLDTAYLPLSGGTMSGSIDDVTSISFQETAVGYGTIAKDGTDMKIEAAVTNLQLSAPGGQIIAKHATEFQGGWSSGVASVDGTALNGFRLVDPSISLVAEFSEDGISFSADKDGLGVQTYYLTPSYSADWYATGLGAGTVLDVATGAATLLSSTGIELASQDGVVFKKGTAYGGTYSSFGSVTKDGSDMKIEAVANLKLEAATQVKVMAELSMESAKIVSLADPTSNQDAATMIYVDGKVSDTAYGSGWNGVTGVAPSKNAVYDQMELKLNLAGGTMGGDIDMDGNAIVGLASPILSDDAATKGYVDTQIAGFSTTASGITYTPAVGGNLSATNVQAAIEELDSEKVAKAGDTMTGFLTLSADPSSNLHAATKQYVDGKVSDTAYGSGWNGVIDVAPSKNAVYDQMELKLNLAGGTMTGALTLSGDPTSALHAATKGYVDGELDTLAVEQLVHESFTLGDLASGDLTSIDTAYTIVGQPMVMVGRVVLLPTADFTVSGTTITWAGPVAQAGAEALEEDDVVHVYYHKSVSPFA